MQSDATVQRYRRVSRASNRARDDKERDDKREARSATMICICEVVCIAVLLALGVGIGLGTTRSTTASPPPPPQHPPFPPGAVASSASSIAVSETAAAPPDTTDAEFATLLGTVETQLHAADLPIANLPGVTLTSATAAPAPMPPHMNVNVDFVVENTAIPSFNTMLADPAQPGFGIFAALNLTSQGDRTVVVAPMFVMDPPPSLPPPIRSRSARPGRPCRRAAARPRRGAGSASCG